MIHGLRTKCLVVVGSAMLLSMASASASETAQPLSPSSPWQADFGDESCALKRMFGEGENQVILEFRKFGPGRNVQLTIFGPSLVPVAEPFTYVLPASTASAQTSRHLIRNFAGGHSGVTATVRFPTSKDAGESSDESTHLLITGGFEEQISLDTGPMDKPVEVLNHCTKNLLKVWGITQDIDDKRPRRARITNLNRVRAELEEKYNALSRSRRDHGLLRLRIMVDASGAPTSCHNQAPSALEAFIGTACQTVMRLAKFEPGLDSGENPVPSYYLMATTYRQP